MEIKDALSTPASAMPPPGPHVTPGTLRQDLEHLFKAWGLALLMMAALLLGGCVPAGAHAQILIVRPDPSLGLKQLQQERVAILPALASTPLMDARALAPVRAQLASHLAVVRPTIALANAGDTDTLGERPDLAPALESFARTQAIAREDLAAIGAATGARYAVFVVFDEYSFIWGDLPAPEYRDAPEASTTSAADPWDDAVEPAFFRRPPTPALAFWGGGHVHVHVQVHVGSGGRVGLGIWRVPGPPPPTVVTYGDPRRQDTVSLPPRRDGKASARLVGTLSIFDAVEGRAVWVGAAMVNQTVESLGMAGPPEPAKLTPAFFEALVGRWPS
jgi:hypothetical protein